MPEKYIQNPDVICREEPYDEWLFFNPDTNQKWAANFLGAYIWNLCDAPRDLESLAAAVRAEFDDVPDQNVEDDIQSLLNSMTNAGFLHRTS